MGFWDHRLRPYTSVSDHRLTMGADDWDHKCLGLMIWVWATVWHHGVWETPFWTMGVWDHPWDNGCFPQFGTVAGLRLGQRLALGTTNRLFGTTLRPRVFGDHRLVFGEQFGSHSADRLGPYGCLRPPRGCLALMVFWTTSVWVFGMSCLRFGTITGLTLEEMRQALVQLTMGWQFGLSFQVDPPICRER